MNKKTLLCFLVGSALLGVGCSQTSGVIPPTISSTTTSTVETEVSSTPVMPDVATTTVTTTVSLVDRPVSEWPRYEFKELGFSMQLPFADLYKNGGLNDCTKPEGRCDKPTMHSFVLSVQDTKTNENIATIFAKSSDFSFDGGSTPFAPSSLVKNTLGVYRFKNFKFLRSFNLGGRSVSIYEDGVEFFYEWEEEVPKLITVLVPLKGTVLPVAAIIFDEHQFTRDQIAQIAKTITFTR